MQHQVQLRLGLDSPMNFRQMASIGKRITPAPTSPLFQQVEKSTSESTSEAKLTPLLNVQKLLL